MVWVKKTSHHFLQTFRPLGYACLRLCSAIVHFIRKITFILSAKADQRKRWPHISCIRPTDFCSMIELLHELKTAVVSQQEKRKTKRLLEFYK